MKVVSVTEALSLVSNLDKIPRHTLENKAEIGRAVHRWIEHDLKADSDENAFGEFDRFADPDESIAGYVEGWDVWKSGVGKDSVFESEIEVRSDVLGLVGHPDFVHKTLAGRWLYDVKCVAKENDGQYRMQLAAYQFMYPEALEGRSILYLKPDGTHRVSQIKSDYKADLTDFMAVLRAYRIKEGLT